MAKTTLTFEVENIYDIAIKKGTPIIKVPTDENGKLSIDMIDKEKYPDLYDWAVNG